LQRDAEVTEYLSFVRYCQSCERFDSKPILLWLQRDAEVTGNFVSCLQLSKLKLGLELKQKFNPEATISEQFQPNSANVKKHLLSQLWNLRGW